MKNNIFTKLVLLNFPEFGTYDGFFYFKPVDQVMTGFKLEKTRRGAYIWKIVYPLFDPKSRINLTYSKRIVGEFGFIEDANKYTNEELANHFCERIKPHIYELKSLTNAHDFNKYILDNDDYLSNPMIRAVFACSNILEGNHEVAKQHFCKAIIDIEGYGGAISELGIKQVYEILASDPVGSTKILESIMEETRKVLS